MENLYIFGYVVTASLISGLIALFVGFALGNKLGMD